MATEIHPAASVLPKAEIGANVKVGPFCSVDEYVRLDDGVELLAHVAVGGFTEVGEGTVIYPFAAVGFAPQDMKYAGEPSRLVIGKNNRIREHVTIHPGTKTGKMLTSVGDGCLFMATTHVAHDCMIGNSVVMANNATLGGHVEVGDCAVLGGLCAIHQFVRIGQYAMVGGTAGVESDVIPYGLVQGRRANLSGLNMVGMKRRGIGSEEIRTMRNAYRQLFTEPGSFANKLIEVAEVYSDEPRVMEIVEFVKSPTLRAISQPEIDHKG
ncbi:MAG: acyl-ACP--UDP-N-acetylglucosamine O-acyltransferase [Geminicoccaceae bacterium]